MTLKSMLTVNNLVKNFGGVRAIIGSTFTIEKGKTTALIGPNGAGKTTLFDIITGFVRSDRGTVVYAHYNITNAEPWEIAALGISRTFQQVRLFHYLTILDHLRMIETKDDTKIFQNIFSKKKVDVEKFQTILDAYGIIQPLETLVSELSFGQRKLLQLALALERPHKMLLLDEPVSGVNKVLQATIEEKLLALKRQGETMIIIDHDMNFVRKLADHVIVLDAGVVLVQGKPEDVLCDPKVLAAYLGE